MDPGFSRGAEAASSTDNNNKPPWVRIADYDARQGWTTASTSEARARQCCEQLEAGEILSFDGIPYDFPEADMQFLLQQRQSSARIHKNISYRPTQDALRGNVSDRPEDEERLHKIMRHFSQEITRL